MEREMGPYLEWELNVGLLDFTRLRKSHSPRSLPQPFLLNVKAAVQTLDSILMTSSKQSYYSRLSALAAGPSTALLRPLRAHKVQRESLSGDLRVFRPAPS